MHRKFLEFYLPLKPVLLFALVKERAEIFIRNSAGFYTQSSLYSAHLY